MLSSICRYLWNFYNYKREKHFSHQNTKTHSSPPCMILVSQNRVPISQHWPHLESKVHRRWSMPLYMYNQQLPYGCSSLQNNNPKCTNSKLVVSCKRFDLDISKQHLRSAFGLFSLMLFIFSLKLFWSSCIRVGRLLELQVLLNADMKIWKRANNLLMMKIVYYDVSRILEYVMFCCEYYKKRFILK